MPGGRLKTTEDHQNAAIVYYDAQGNEIFRIDGVNRRVAFAAGSGLTLPTSQAVGFIDLPLNSWRVTNAANTDYGLVAATALIGSGGVGGIDAEPSLTRVNVATDPTTRLVWLDGKLDTILNDFTLPPDVDAASPLIFKCLAAMSGTNDATSILTLTWTATAAGAYAAGANQGGATSAFAAVTTLVQKSVTIAAAAINAPGSHVSVSLTPTSPGTDAMHLYGTWVEYTKKLA